jgi:hypothetical protein
MSILGIEIKKSAVELSHAQIGLISGFHSGFDYVLWATMRPSRPNGRVFTARFFWSIVFRCRAPSGLHRLIEMD